ncbi:MAG: metallophosphoesterase [Lachnospiraceae bacterium]|nr:metallophosphoesterase [Lachnospiraceae bacterium]
MAKYQLLKADIDAKVYQNGKQEITGENLNSVLNAMVASLGVGYQFMGMATPTNPGTAQTPDYKCFYIATTPGKYTNLGGLVVADGEVAILKYDSSWTKEVTGAATADQVSQLGQYVDNPEWVRVVTDSEDKILYGVKADGKFYFGDGCPPQVVEYIEDKVEAIDKRIDEIVQDKDNIVLPQLPDYYFENDYIDNKVKYINEKIRECSNNGDAFFWITDVHWESDRNARYSPSLISYIRQRTNIPRLFNGGDNFDGIEGRVGSPDRAAGFDGNIDFTNRLRKALGSDKVYTVIGNHEVITYNTYPEIFYALRQHNDDVVYGDADKSYFYVDNNQQKIRYVVLTAFGVQEEGITPPFRNEFKENPEQLDWLMGTALNLSSDWTVVIFLHGLFMIGTRSSGSHYSPQLSSLNSRKVAWGEPWEFENVWIDSIENYANNKIGKVIDYDPRPLDGQGNIDISLAETVSSVPAIADKFMLYSPDSSNTYKRYVARIQWYSAGQVWKLVWTEYGTYESATSLNVGDEVIIWKAFGGKIAGVIQGHTHADRLHLEAGIPFIISACDKWNEAGGDDLTVTRTKGTITEQHFEVVVLNKTLQKWTFISIGAPASGGYDDNVGEDVQVREISYQ